MGTACAGGNAGSNFLSVAVIHTNGTSLEVYLTNQGKTNLSGVIQSAARCVLELNGKYFAMEDFGGKSSFTPPGKTLGPISIDLTKFTEIQNLAPACVIDPKAPHPEFREGVNHVRVHFKILRGPQDVLVPSVEIEINK
jgi:hypothetical protein